MGRNLASHQLRSLRFSRQLRNRIILANDRPQRRKTCRRYVQSLGITPLHFHLPLSPLCPNAGKRHRYCFTGWLTTSRACRGSWGLRAVREAARSKSRSVPSRGFFAAHLISSSSLDLHPSDSVGQQHHAGGQEESGLRPPGLLQAASHGGACCVSLSRALSLFFVSQLGPYDVSLLFLYHMVPLSYSSQFFRSPPAVLSDPPSFCLF